MILELSGGIRGVEYSVHCSSETLEKSLQAVQAADGISLSGTERLLLLAATEGMDRRQDRREERRDNRRDRPDTRQDCRDEEGVVGKDRRDCKQAKRQGRREDNND